MAPTETEITFGDTRVELSTFDRYKGRMNTTDRLALVSETLVRGFYHYISGKTFKCLSTKGHRACCCEHGGEPTQGFGLVVFHYLTDERGNLVDPAKLQGKTKIWKISESRYEELSTLHRQWPLLDAGMTEKQVDILMRCTDEKFQRMQITPCPEAQWKKRENWYKAVKERARKAKDKVKGVLGREMTEVEVMELLGMAPAQATGNTANAGDLDLSDVLEEPMATSASAEANPVAAGGEDQILEDLDI